MGNFFVAALVDTLGHWMLRVIPVWSDMGFAMVSSIGASTWRCRFAVRLLSKFGGLHLRGFF